MHLVLRGTNSQIQVWQGMLRTRPGGQVLSYTDVAQAVGAPRAQRAVGSALGANTIACLVPCHRVIRGSGEISHYRWGPEQQEGRLPAARAAPACRADSKFQHGLGSGCRRAISSSDVMSCIFALIDSKPASRSRFIAAVRSVAIVRAPLPR